MYSSNSSRTQSPISFSNYGPGSLPSPATHRHGCMSAAAKRYKYLRRLFKCHQMDFEFAAWQMVYLFISPQKVYRNFQYRKQTKAQFARDDPAFLVLLGVFLLVSSAGFALVLRLTFLEFVRLFAYIVIVDCIMVGIAIASLVWFLSNKYLLKPGVPEDSKVEWGYCFDVHLNALFPLLVLLHGIMILLYHAVISHEWTISMVLGNTLWLIALGYYNYITFLGYSCLQTMRSTRIFLYPLSLLVVVYLVTLLLGWNISTSLINFYKYRVL
ncbi:protein unc-50 homolog [Folsomia candida]|uniref:Protein unc-50 n=1 Tax=Folsomia candida TaxID=158441 RepID=A0A226ETI6_FOLCA|nr:protein unc-50 homolog [Folsomia candida]OXA60518.1 Protein unc-50 [Folsomia candida]